MAFSVSACILRGPEKHRVQTLPGNSSGSPAGSMSQRMPGNRPKLAKGLRRRSLHPPQGLGERSPKGPFSLPPVVPCGCARSQTRGKHPSESSLKLRPLYASESSQTPGACAPASPTQGLDKISSQMCLRNTFPIKKYPILPPIRKNTLEEDVDTVTAQDSSTHLDGVQEAQKQSSSGASSVETSSQK